MTNPKSAASYALIMALIQEQEKNLRLMPSHSSRQMGAANSSCGLHSTPKKELVDFVAPRRTDDATLASSMEKVVEDERNNEGAVEGQNPISEGPEPLSQLSGGSQVPEIVPMNTPPETQQQGTSQMLQFNPSQLPFTLMGRTTPMTPKDNKLNSQYRLPAVSPARSNISGISRVSQVSTASRRSKGTNSTKMAAWRTLDTELMQHSQHLVARQPPIYCLVDQHNKFWKMLANTCVLTMARSQQQHRLMVEFTVKLTRANEFMIVCGVEAVAAQLLEFISTTLSKFIMRPSVLFATSLSWIQAKEILHMVIDSVHSFMTMLRISTVFAEIIAKFASTWANNPDEHKSYYAFVMSQLTELQTYATTRISNLEMNSRLTKIASKGQSF